MIEILNEIEQALPPIATRKVLTQTLGGLVSQRTWANKDSLGTGIKGRVRLGKNIAYKRSSVMAWLAKNLEEDNE